MCRLRKKSANTPPSSRIVSLNPGFSSAFFFASAGRNFMWYTPKTTITMPMIAIIVVQAITVP